MTTNFTKDGIRYTLVTAPMGLREREQMAEQIGPDANLWTTLQQKKYGLKNYNEKSRLGFVEEKQERRMKGGSEPHKNLAPPRPEDFTDRLEYR